MQRAIFFLCLLSACVQHDLDPPLIDCLASDLSIELVEVTEATTCTSPDGQILVNAQGGKPPYLFVLNEVTSINGSFGGLSSGGYSISVIDDQGCTATLSNVIIPALNFSFDAIVVANTDCTGGNGAIELEVNEGTAPFEFRFMDNGFSDSNVFTSLEDGTYQLEVRDAIGCSASLEITVPRGATGTSWINSIRPLMSTYCALSGCHNGISRPDLRTYDNAKFYASQIKALTQDRSMPFEGSLTQDQIDLIACWVDEGAFEN